MLIPCPISGLAGSDLFRLITCYLFGPLRSDAAQTQPVDYLSLIIGQMQRQTTMLGRIREHGNIIDIDKTIIQKEHKTDLGFEPVMFSFTVRQTCKPPDIAICHLLRSNKTDSFTKAQLPTICFLCAQSQCCRGSFVIQTARRQTV